MNQKEFIKKAPCFQKHGALDYRIIDLWFESTLFFLQKNNQPPKAIGYFWWKRVDSNHRSRRQQIYSLPPLATRELFHVGPIKAHCLSPAVELVNGLEPLTC